MKKFKTISREQMASIAGGKGLVTPTCGCGISFSCDSWSQCQCDCHDRCGRPADLRPAHCDENTQ